MVLAPVKVSAFLLHPGSDVFADYVFTPDSARLVYRSDVTKARKRAEVGLAHARPAVV